MEKLWAAMQALVEELDQQYDTLEKDRNLTVDKLAEIDAARENNRQMMHRLRRSMSALNGDDEPRDSDGSVGRRLATANKAAPMESYPR